MPDRSRASIRSARAGDGESLAPLLAQLGYPTGAREARIRLERLIATPDAGVLVAEAGGELVGLASFQIAHMLYRTRPQCRITALVVDARHRRRGTASALVEAVERRARERDCHRLELTTRPDRGDALPFYRAIGFAERPHRLVRGIAA